MFNRDPSPMYVSYDNNLIIQSLDSALTLPAMFGVCEKQLLILPLTEKKVFPFVLSLLLSNMIIQSPLQWRWLRCVRSSFGF